MSQASSARPSIVTAAAIVFIGAAPTDPVTPIAVALPIRLATAIPTVAAAILSYTGDKVLESARFPYAPFGGQSARLSPYRMGMSGRGIVFSVPVVQVLRLSLNSPRQLFS